MHYIIGILGAIAGLFWAFTHFSNSARQGKDAVDEVRGAFRRQRWSNKIDKRLIETLDDPREALAIFLYQILAYDGAITERQRLAMVAEMQATFGIDQPTAEEFFALARMATGEITDAANNVRKIAKPLVQRCQDAEKTAAIAMMRRLAAVEGPVNDQQTHLIATIETILRRP
ncbi:MAG: TerB family tellurite resistance protein [Pseudomonadota bacterium]